MRAAIGLSLITALVLLEGGSGPPPRLGDAAVTPGSAALIGLGYYLSQSAWLAGLAYWTLYRPLVAGLVVGAILGDPWAGARVGATLNIAFLGFLGTGAALPTDMALVGYAGAAIALATGLSATASLALALPLGALGYGLYRVRLRWGNAPARWAERYAQRGDVRGIAWCNVVVPQAMLILLALMPGAAVAYLAPRVAYRLVGVAPGWVAGWLDVTGALLVALGAAAGLALVWARRTAGCYLGAAVVAMAMVAVSAAGREMALLVGVLGAAAAAALPWLARGRAADGEGPATRQGAASVRGGPPPEGGAVRGGDRLATLMTWLFFSHSGYSEDRRQGLGLAHAMAPVLRRLYPTRAELGRALTRYLPPFNVEPNLGSAVIGVLGNQEEALARGQLPPGAPEETRSRLAGPVSGVGDTVIHGAIGTVAMALGAAVAAVAGPAGAMVYVALMAAVVWGISGWAFVRGYRGGFPGVLELLRGDGWRRVVVGAECAGAIVIGVLTVGPVADTLGPLPGGAGAGPGSPVARALASLPALALVLAFLALQRWGVRQRWLVTGCFGAGLVAALLRL